MQPIANMLQAGVLRRVALPSVHAAVPPVLDRIVAAVAQSPRDLGPSLANLVDQLFDHFPFLRGNRVMVQTGLEILVVALATLFRRAMLELL